MGETTLVTVPGPWRAYHNERLVRCESPVTSAGAGYGGTCNRAVIRIGRRKLGLVRLVGTKAIPVPPDVDGCTIRCECGAIYEVTWWDRRRRDRTGDDRDRRKDVPLTEPPAGA